MSGPSSAVAHSDTTPLFRLIWKGIVWHKAPNVTGSNEEPCILLGKRALVIVVAQGHMTACRLDEENGPCRPDASHLSSGIYVKTSKFCRQTRLRKIEWTHLGNRAVAAYLPTPPLRMQIIWKVKKIGKTSSPRSCSNGVRMSFAWTLLNVTLDDEIKPLL